MNIIGKNVKAAKKLYKYDDLIIIHDDLEQKLGKFKVV